MAATILKTKGKGGCCFDNSCPESSSFKINSIYIDLDSAYKTEEKRREKFSIRGYVADELQKKDEKSGWPFAWNNHRTDETVSVFETSKSEPTQNPTDDINARNDLYEDCVNPDLFNISLISTTASMNSSLNYLLGEAMTVSQDRREKGARIPTPIKTLNEELQFLVGCHNLKNVTCVKCPVTCPRGEDAQEEEIVICGRPEVPCLVNNDCDSSQEKDKHPSVGQSCSLLVEGAQDDVQHVYTGGGRYEMSNMSNIKKTRRRRTRLLSELLGSEKGNHVAASSRPKTELGGNVKKYLLNDEEWRPYKMNTKNISNKKKIPKRRKKSNTRPDNFQQTCNGIPDDVPMEIVELMAKNQYERCSNNTAEATTTDISIAVGNTTTTTIPCNKNSNLLEHAPYDEHTTTTTTTGPCNKNFNLSEMEEYAPYEELTTTTTGPCNKNFSLSEMEEYAPYEEHTSTSSQASRWNTGVHIKSRNGILKSWKNGGGGCRNGDDLDFWDFVKFRAIAARKTHQSFPPPSLTLSRFQDYCQKNTRRRGRRKKKMMTIDSVMKNNNNYKDYYYDNNTEPCNVNMNPSDFSAPSGRNAYMIDHLDLVISTKKE